MQKHLPLPVGQSLWSVLPISEIDITSTELVHIHHCLKLETPLSGSRSVLDGPSWCIDAGDGLITNSCTFLLLYLSVYLYFHIHHCFKIQTPLSSSRSVLVGLSWCIDVGAARSPSPRPELSTIHQVPIRGPHNKTPLTLVFSYSKGDMTNMQPAHMSLEY